MMQSKCNSVMLSLHQTVVSSPKLAATIFSHKAWKKLMQKVLQNLQNQNPKKSILIKNMKIILKNLPQSKMIQAVLELRKFKPDPKQYIQSFRFSRPQNDYGDQQNLSSSKNSIDFLTKANQSNQISRSNSSINLRHSLKPLKSSFKYTRWQILQQKKLMNEFDKKQHPYYFIISNFMNLLEIKYQKIISNNQNKTIKNIQQGVRSDMNILFEFLNQVSRPYKDLFLATSFQQNILLTQKYRGFLTKYIKGNSVINTSIRQIILFYVRNKLSSYPYQKIPESNQIQIFKIPKQLQIEGRYVSAMTYLIEFSSNQSPEFSLEKLVQFRNAIFQDIDRYYLQKEEKTKKLLMNAEAQNGILKFIIAKLKSWACQIYAQLKYLQTVYGDDQMACQFEQASFIYAQLLTIFQIFGFP